MKLLNDGAFPLRPAIGRGGVVPLLVLLIALTFLSACNLSPQQGTTGEEEIVAKAESTATPTAGTPSRPPSGGGTSEKSLATNETYAKYCVICHKQNGFGVASAPVGYRDFVAGLGQEGLARAISQGKGPMPAWGKATGGPLSEPEISALAAYILANASSTRPTPVAPAAKGAATATPTAAAPSATPAPGAAAGPPGKMVYDQFCGGCHPVAAAVAPAASRAAAKKYVPGLTDGQADIILDYLRGPGATAQAPSGTPGAAQPAPPRAPAGGPPPKIPHSLGGKEGKCLECHGRGAMAPYPVGHTGRTVETCLLCHEVSLKPAPPMAHRLEGRAGRCLICHGSGGGASRIPPSHSGRSINTCAICH